MKNKFIIIVVLAFFVRILLSLTVSHVDINSLADWGERFWIYGPKNFYFNTVWAQWWPSQPPFFILVLAISRFIYTSIIWLLIAVHETIRFYPSIVIRLFADFGYKPMIKLPAILADIGIGWMIYSLLKKDKNALTAAAFYLLNPVSIYISSLWGQYESIVVFWGLLAFWFLERNRFIRSLLSMFVAFYTKISILIWIPFYVYVFLIKKPNLTQLARAILITLVVFSVTNFLFAKDVSIFKFSQDMFTQKILIGAKGTERLAMSAFNVWSLGFGFNEQTADTKMWFLSGKAWGILVSLVIFFGGMWYSKKPSPGRVFTSLFVCSMGAILFLTNMHERYYFLPWSAMVLSAGYNKYLYPPLVLFSFVLLGNLHFSWWLKHVKWVEVFFKSNDELGVRVFSFLMVLVLGWSLFLIRRDKFNRR